MQPGTKLFLLTLSSLFVASFAAAQTPTASLVGRAMTGRSPLPDVTVTVSSPESVVMRVAITSATGDYSIDGLPPGRWSITFAKEGFQTVTRPAELHVALTSRADARLERTEVGESISLTAPTPSIRETAEVATNLVPDVIDVLPVRRSIAARALLAPAVLPTAEGAIGIDGASAAGTLYLIDGVRSRRSGPRAQLVIEEAIDETTVITGAAPAEYGRFSGGVIAAMTRSGSNEFNGSLRADILRGSDDLLQAAAGGRFMPDRLWFFTAGAFGEDGTAAQKRTQAKLTGALTSSQAAVASYTRGFDGDAAEGSLFSLHYDGAIARNTVVEALYGSSTANNHSWLVKGSQVLSTASAGTHALSAGYERMAEVDDGGAFIDDRMSFGTRWTFETGFRYDRRLQPRLAAIYDLHGDGLRRISAGWARYEGEDGRSTDEITAGYGAQISNNGFIRVDAIRRATGTDQPWRAAELQWSYSFLGIVDFGGYYALQDGPDAATGWIIVQPPIGFGRISFAILQPYRGHETETDLATTYSFPRSVVSLFLKADLLNAFDSRGTAVVDDRQSIPGQRRTIRFAAGLRY